MAFVKGQSGNPNGRRKESKDVIELAKKHTAEAIRKLAEIMRGDNTRAAVHAANSLLDRAHGKPVQQLNHAGHEGEALPTEIVFSFVEPNHEQTDN